MQSDNYTCRIPWVMNTEDEGSLQKVASLAALNIILAILNN